LDRGVKLDESEIKELIQDLDFLGAGENGVLVAVVPGLRKLMMSSVSSN